MIDGWGRNIDYLRISLTDRCNLRCVYCMPEEGVCSLAHQDILSYGEILRLVQIGVSLGIHRIKLTGGEPLVRKDVPRLVRELKEIPGVTQVTLTTNGVLLAEAMAELSEAGIDGINLSLDTLDRLVYEKITRRDSLEQAMQGFYEVLKYANVPLKINCVPAGLEGQNVLDLAELARQYPVHVRYIEVMPIGPGREFAFCGEAEIMAELEKRYGQASAFAGALGNGPGHYYTFPDFQGKIGFISAISHKFCDSCNRIRLTSQGYLKSCLQYDMGTDLRKPLRSGASDEELRSIMREVIRNKPVGHRFHERNTAHEENGMMSQFGG